MRDGAIREAKGDDALPPERRLKLLLFLVPFEPIGLFGFAWTSLGQKYGLHWIGSMIVSTMVGVANCTSCLSSVDYMIASHGVYSASACGKNAFAQDLLAGICAMYATPRYNIIRDKWHVEYACTILACLSCLVVAPTYVFNWKGPRIRERSKFAQPLEAKRRKYHGRRVSQTKAEP
jgi:hypothetical protein